MPWYIHLLIANGAIFCLEYIYRAGHYTNFFSSLVLTLPLILIAQYSLFYGFRVTGATTLFLAGAVFTLVNVAMRIINSFVLGEIPNGYNWAGILLLIVAVTLLRIR